MLMELWVSPLLNHEHLVLLSCVATILSCLLVVTNLVSTDVSEATVAEIHAMMLTHMYSDPTFTGVELAQLTCLSIDHCCLNLFFRIPGDPLGSRVPSLRGRRLHFICAIWANG